MNIFCPIALDLIYEKQPYTTYSPTFSTTGTYSVTLSTTTAKYRRFGNFLHVLWYGTSTSTPSGAGGVIISLPFSVVGTEIGAGWNASGAFTISVQCIGSGLLCHNRDNTTPFTANSQIMALSTYVRIA